MPCLNELLQNIKNHSLNLKVFEESKNYVKASEILESIILLLNQSINNEKQEQLNSLNIPQSPNLKLLQTLLCSYITKKNSYD